MKRSAVFIGILGLSLSLSAQPTGPILQRVDLQLRKMMADWECPGMAVAIVKDDTVIFAKGYGVRELGKPELVDENTLFAVGSQTKAFTAAALAILVDEGKLKWDDPVVKYLPQFELSDPELTRRISIRDCLTHRSGIDSLSAQFLFTDLSREEILRRYRYAKPIGDFRSSFDYNNILFRPGRPAHPRRHRDELGRFRGGADLQAAWDEVQQHQHHPLYRRCEPRLGA